MHLQSTHFLTILLAFALTQSGSTHAAVVLEFEGEPYNEFIPSGAGNPFTGADRIVGTFMFDNIGDASATGFTLSTTVGGAPGFTFNVPDVNNPGPFSVTLNTFDWNGGPLPQDFGLTVAGEVFGALDGIESISIDEIGDIVTIDFLGTDEFNAFNMSAGTFTDVTAVPEPSSVVLVGIALGAGFFRHQRKKRFVEII